jgi:hypothetical protein
MELSVQGNTHSSFTNDKLATKFVNEGNKLPIAFILALLAKILLRNE